MAGTIGRPMAVIRGPARSSPSTDLHEGPPGDRGGRRRVAPGETGWYRALAFSIDDRVIAASPALSATAKPTKSLGPLSAAAPGAGSVELGWAPFGGSTACFSCYKVVWSTSTATPSYLGSHDGAVPLEAQTAAATAIDGLASGGTWFRVQAIRATPLGKVVVAQTEVAYLEVP